MFISSRNLIEVNATIIVGLLILLTFQFIQTGDEGLRTKIANLGVEREMLEIKKEASQQYLTDLCPNEFFNFKTEKPFWYMLDKEMDQDCKQMILEHVKTNQTLNTLNTKMKHVGETIPELLSKKGIPQIFLNGVKTFLLIPFITAIIVELLLNQNEKEGVKSLGISRKLSIIGFLLLGFVLSIDAILSFYETNIFPLTMLKN